MKRLQVNVLPSPRIEQALRTLREAEDSNDSHFDADPEEAGCVAYVGAEASEWAGSDDLATCVEEGMFAACEALRRNLRVVYRVNDGDPTQACGYAFFVGDEGEIASLLLTMAERITNGGWDEDEHDRSHNGENPDCPFCAEERS